MRGRTRLRCRHKYPDDLPTTEEARCTKCGHRRAALAATTKFQPVDPDEELSAEEIAALRAYQQAEGMHPAWGGEVEVDGERVAFVAHAAFDPTTIAALNELAVAAVRHTREDRAKAERARERRQ